MTAAEAAEIIRRRILLKNPPMEMTLGTEVVHDDSISMSTGRIRIWVKYRVPARDTGDVIPISNWQDIMLWDGFREEELVDMVEYQVRGAFLHEFGETFHLDGVRVRDPHAGEKL